MGIHTVEGTSNGPDGDPAFVMFCSTTNVAFGPVFQSYAQCEAFQGWMRTEQFRPLPMVRDGRDWAELRDLWASKDYPGWSQEDDEVVVLGGPALNASATEEGKIVENWRG